MIELALATAVIAMTVTRSSVFRPIQCCKLLRCPYCFAHWVALALCLPQDDFVIKTLVVIALSVPVMFLIHLFMERIDA